MPTTSEDEKAIGIALANLQEATRNCSKQDLHYLWRRDVLPTHIYEWLRLERKGENHDAKPRGDE